jgi:hypothetical protein
MGYFPTEVNINIQIFKTNIIIQNPLHVIKQLLSE